MAADAVIRIRAADFTAAGVDSAKRNLNELGPAGQRAGQQASAGLDRVDDSAKRTNVTLRNLIGGLAGFEGARRIISAADAYASINARLQLVTRSQREYLAAQAQTLAIAQRTQTDLASTATLYGKLDSAVRSLGGSQADALRLTELINQTFRISGATAAESGAGVLQLSQALASGVLRGDEFNSVMESSPRLAKALADGLGVPIGALRKMAEEGELTADRVIKALQGQSAKIAAEYAQLPQTVGGAFQRLSNSATVFIGKLDSATGATKLLAGGLNALADNIGTVVSAAAGLAVIGTVLGGAVAAVTAIAGAIALFTSRAADLERAQSAITSSAEAIEKMRAASEGLRTGAVSVDAFRQAAEALRPELARVLEEQERVKQSIVDTRREAEITGDFGTYNDLLRLQGELEQKLIELQGEFRRVKGETDEATAALKRQQEAMRPAQRAIEDLKGITAQLADEQKRVADALARAQFGDKAVREAKIAGTALAGLTGVLADGVPLFERFRLAKDLAFQTTSAVQLASQISKNEAALKKLRDAEIAAAKATRDAAKASDDWLDVQELLDRAQYQYIGTLNRYGDAAERALEKMRAGAVELETALNNELRVSQLSGAARAALIRHIEAEAQARQALGQRTEANAAEYDAELARLTSLGEARAAQIEANNQAREASERAAYEYRRAWGSAIDDVIESFVRGSGSIKDIAKRLMQDLAIQLARKLVFNFGANLQGSGAGGGIIGSLFGGGGQQGGGLGGFNLLGSLGGGTGILGSIGSLFGGGGAGFSGTAAGGPFSGLFNFANRAVPTSGFAGGLFGSNAGGFGSFAGNALGAAGGLYGVYSAFRSGNPLSGAASGAAAGTAIFPGVGTIIGGIVGALAGLLGGQKPPDLRLGGLGVTRKPEVTFQTALGTSQVGVRGGVDEREFIKLVTDFDKNLAQVIGTFRDGDKQLIAVQQSLSRWAVDLKGDAISAEAVLNGRFGAILSTFSTDVQNFVNQAGTLEEKVQRLSEAAFIDAAAAAGTLGTTFGEVADLLQRNRAEGEALADTYNRIVGGVALFDSALLNMGIASGRTKKEVADLAARLVGLSGGLEGAAARLERYYEVLYTPEEREAAALAAARTRRDTALRLAGFDPSVSDADFRTRANQILATGTAEQIDRVLEAADAIGDYNEIIGVGTARLREAADAERERQAALRQATLDYSSFSAGLRRQIEAFGQTDYQRSVAQINQEFQEGQTEALRLAQAMGLFAARSEDVTLLLQRQTLQMAEAGRQLERTVLRSLQDLYGQVEEEVPVGSELALLGWLRGVRTETRKWGEELALLERMDAATMLARNLRDLFERQGISVADGLQRYTVPLNKLLKDFGADLSDLTNPKTIDALGRLAGVLGISVEALLKAAGIDVSNFTQEQIDTANATAGNATQQNPQIRIVNASETAAAGIANVEKAVRDLSKTELQVDDSDTVSAVKAGAATNAAAVADSTTILVQVLRESRDLHQRLLEQIQRQNDHRLVAGVAQP